MAAVFELKKSEAQFMFNFKGANGEIVLPGPPAFDSPPLALMGLTEPLTLCPNL